MMFTFFSPDEFDKALEETRQATGRDKISEVLGDGMEFYDLIVDQLRQGKHIYIGDCRETAGEVVLPHLERARMQGTPPDDSPPRDKIKLVVIEGGKQNDKGKKTVSDGAVPLPAELDEPPVG